MNFKVVVSSEDIQEALKLIRQHLDNTDISDDADVCESVKCLLCYIVHSIYSIIDPFDEPALAGEIEQFDSNLLDKVITLVQKFTDNPILKPLLPLCNIVDMNLINDDGLLVLELEIKKDGNAGPIPTFKASFF